MFQVLCFELCIHRGQEFVDRGNTQYNFIDYPRWILIFFLNFNCDTDIENKLVVAKGEEGWGREEVGVWG